MKSQDLNTTIKIELNALLGFIPRLKREGACTIAIL